MLMEFADAMGIDKEEAKEMITSVGPREPIIPESEADREMEIRMLAMIVAADGVLGVNEHDLLSKMALLMEVPRSYLDQALDFYLQKERERINNRHILHNLYIIAKADGEVTEEEFNLLLDVAYNLGQKQEDISMVLDNKLPDVLNIPDDKEEQWYSLKNLVFMMIVDGEISEPEYELCLGYAEAIGLGEEEIEDIIDEYQSLGQESGPTGQGGNPANHDAILDTFNTLRTIETPVEDLVNQFELVLEEDDLPQTFDKDDEKNRACLELMWLMFVWAPSLTNEASTLIPMYLDLAMSKGTWTDMRDYLLQLETTYGQETIPFLEWETDELMQELVEG